MPATRPNLSITLPRNFTFHYTDGQGPRTPEEGKDFEPQQPSPPRPFRLRTRRRPGTSCNNPDSPLPLSNLSQDAPIPTIEAPELALGISGSMTEPVPEPVEGLLAPLPSRQRGKSPPKTPSTQISTTFDAPEGDRPDWSRISESQRGEDLGRPGSACSDLSDSSESSSNSLSSFPSTGGSCTSPESDAADPFVFPPSDAKGKGKARPKPPGTESTSLLRKSRNLKSTQWGDDMDTHLWTTYLLYLQDPTVTPFRTSSGGAPPLGVCCRVAREAKRSWKGPKVALSGIPESGGLTVDVGGNQILRDVNDEANAVKMADSPNTVESSRSGSATPTGTPAKKPVSKWPGSESATRRRLRELCRRKSTPSSLQQRFLQSRSPTPFQRSRPRLESPFRGHKPSFSTRDMSFSLTTSTSATMQRDGPLARLAQSLPRPQSESEEWFGQPIALPQPGPAQPLQLGLGIDGIDGGSNIRRLGSPFPERLKPGPLQSSHLRPQPPRTQSDNETYVGPALKSPVRLTASLGYSSAHKRRAQHQLEDELSPGGSDVRQSFFEELFGAPAESSHRRVRSRGFSLGDVSQGSRLASLVTPPTIYDQMNSSEFTAATSVETRQSDRVERPVAPERSQRLGSPFVMPGPSNRSQRESVLGEGFRSGVENTTHANRGPSYTIMDAPSIEERLEQLDRDDAVRKRIRG